MNLLIAKFQSEKISGDFCVKISSSNSIVAIGMTCCQGIFDICIAILIALWSAILSVYKTILETFKVFFSKLPIMVAGKFLNHKETSQWWTRDYQSQCQLQHSRNKILWHKHNSQSKFSSLSMYLTRKRSDTRGHNSHIKNSF